jgi:hypothetical protein
LGLEIGDAMARLMHRDGLLTALTLHIPANQNHEAAWRIQGKP